MNEPLSPLPPPLSLSLIGERANADEMPVYSRRDGEYTLANNAKPINFQFRQACIADRVCAPFDRNSRPRFRPALSLRARRLPLKVKPTCNFRRTDAARTKVSAGRFGVFVSGKRKEKNSYEMCAVF